MTNKTFILLALIALFSTTAYSQGFLDFPRKLQDLTDPNLITPAHSAEENLIDDLLFGGNEEEMSLEEGEFHNEEGEFSNEEGEFLYSEEEMILVGDANDEIPSVPALSDMIEDEMLDDTWIGASEEEMSFEEGELHYGGEEEMNFGEEAVLDNGEGDIFSDPALSGVIDDEMLDEPWIRASEEEMNFEGEFINEEGELALGEGEFTNEEAEFSFSDLGFGI